MEAPKEDSGSTSASSTKSADAPPTSQPAPLEKPATEAGQKSEVKHHADLSQFPRIFPSVARLLSEYDFPLDKVKGTGLRGMITKGDVLAYLGKASSPTGTYKQDKPTLPEATAPKKKDQEVVKVHRCRMTGTDYVLTCVDTAVGWTVSASRNYAGHVSKVGQGS